MLTSICFSVALLVVLRELYKSRSLLFCNSLEEGMDFNTAAEKDKTLPRCSDGDKLELYGLYKQVTVGDVNTCTFCITLLIV